MEGERMWRGPLSRSYRSGVIGFALGGFVGGGVTLVLTFFFILSVGRKKVMQY